MIWCADRFPNAPHSVSMIRSLGWDVNWFIGKNCYIFFFLLLILLYFYQLFVNLFSFCRLFSDTFALLGLVRKITAFYTLFYKGINTSALFLLQCHYEWSLVYESTDFILQYRRRPQCGGFRVKRESGISSPRSRGSRSDEPRTEAYFCARRRSLCEARLCFSGRLRGCLSARRAGAPPSGKITGLLCECTAWEGARRLSCAEPF